MKADVFEAIGRIQASPTAVGRAAHEGVLVLMFGMWRFMGHSDHYPNIRRVVKRFCLDFVSKFVSTWRVKI